MKRQWWSVYFRLFPRSEYMYGTEEDVLNRANRKRRFFEGMRETVDEDKLSNLNDPYRGLSVEEREKNALIRLLTRIDRAAQGIKTDPTTACQYERCFLERDEVRVFRLAQKIMEEHGVTVTAHPPTVEGGLIVLRVSPTQPPTPTLFTRIKSFFKGTSQ